MKKKKTTFVRSYQLIKIQDFSSRGISITTSLPSLMIRRSILFVFPFIFWNWRTLGSQYLLAYSETHQNRTFISHMTNMLIGEYEQVYDDSDYHNIIQLSTFEKKNRRAKSYKFKSSVLVLMSLDQNTGSQLFGKASCCCIFSLSHCSALLHSLMIYNMKIVI